MKIKQKMTQTKIKKYDISNDPSLKLLELETEFEKECDAIQQRTEDLLNMVPKNDVKRRGLILDLHKQKLRIALETLNYKLQQLS